jgi:hypothetical protein
MAYRRAPRTRSGGRKSARSAPAKRSYRTASRSSAKSSRSIKGRRSAPAQTLKIVIEHAAQNDVARPTDVGAMLPVSEKMKPTKSQF